LTRAKISLLLIKKEVDMPGEMKGAQDRIVIRFRDGRLLKGYTSDFTPLKDTFHLTSAQGNDKGTSYNVATEDLKAVFFVKTFEGNKAYVEKKRFDEVDTTYLQGRRVKLEFFDGEIMRGVSPGYSRGRKGFFIIPVDPKSNNEKIYVISNALRQVELGSAAEK